MTPARGRAGLVGNAVSRLSLNLAQDSNDHAQTPACLPSPVCPLRDDGPRLLLGPKCGEGEGVSSTHLVPFSPLLPLPAQNWCIKRRSQSIYLQVLTDKHAPEHYRYARLPSWAVPSLYLYGGRGDKKGHGSTQKR